MTKTAGAFVFGLARSGTTWCAKILDAHPKTLYRHEPDRPPVFPRMPVVVDPGDSTRYREYLRTFMDELPALNRVRAAGTQPVFRKLNESFIHFHCRRTGTFAARIASLRLGNIRVPLGLPRHSRIGLHLLVKSVWSVGRLGVVADSCPNLHPVLLLRHPAAVIESRRRGIELGAMSQIPLGERDELLSYRGLAAGTWNDVSIRPELQIDFESYRWALLNSKAIKEVSDRGGTVLRYEDLAARPQTVSRGLLENCGLNWHPQVERFVKHSTCRHSSRFYGLNRRKGSTLGPMLDADAQDRINEVIRGSLASQYYVESEKV